MIMEVGYKMTERSLILQLHNNELLKAFEICEKCERKKECDELAPFFDRVMAWCGKWKGVELQPFRDKIRN